MTAPADDLPSIGASSMYGLSAPQRCCFCIKTDFGKYPSLIGSQASDWTEFDLAHGYRFVRGAKEYHCYGAYCD